MVAVTPCFECLAAGRNHAENNLDVNRPISVDSLSAVRLR